LIGSFKPFVEEASLMLSETGAGAEEHVAGGIGNGILKQFTVTLDYAHRSAYFEKNAAFGRAGAPDDVPSAPAQTLGRPDLQRDSKAGWMGIAKLRFPGKTVEIVELDPEGPAARAGIAVGDQILAIDGRPVEEFLKPIKIKSGLTVRFVDPKALYPAPVTELTLTMKRGERVWDVRLVTVR
jgi:C-terminal processing protease CtpA/Prc